MTCSDGKCVNRGEKTTFVYTIVGYERFKAATVDLRGEILKYSQAVFKTVAPQSRAVFDQSILTS